MIRPVLQNEELLTDIGEANHDDGNFRLWWLGQSGFLLQWLGHHLLLDPYLSDSLTKKYAETDKPHVRMTEIPVDPSRLDFIDVVTSSHSHTDHLDAETLQPLLRANPNLKLVIPEASRAFVTERIGCEPNWPGGLDAGESTQLGSFRITAVPAAHETVERDESGRCKYLGYVVSFGHWTAYHSGDTVLYDGIVETLQPFEVDVALLPINGRAPERRVAGNLNAREAAWLAREIGASLVIPMHYEMFTFNTAAPEEFEYAAELERQPHYVLKCGERWDSSSIRPRKQDAYRGY
jgi:L-ascorbate metabolism protein UlaG (beta-lactamase superfamily)